MNRKARVVSLLACFVALGSPPRPGLASGCRETDPSGTYVVGFLDQPDGLCRIQTRGEGIVISFPDNEDMTATRSGELWTIDEDQGKPSVRAVSFRTDESGDPTAAIWHQSGYELTMPRYLEPSPDSSLADKLGSIVRSYADGGLFSGVVLIALDGQTVLTSAHGGADLSWPIPNTVETRFDLASVSKSITASAILRLVEHGDLELDMPVSRVLGELKGTWADHATVRHLLSHRAGLPRVVHDDSDQLYLRQDRATLIDRLQDIEPHAKPGAAYEYSNCGFRVLALIVERVSGLRFPEAVNNLVLEPLGMSDTIVQAVRGLIPRAAEPYSVVLDDLVPARSIDPSNRIGSGGVFSTADDLLRFARAVRDGLLHDAATLKAMWGSPQSGYGLGWFVGEKGGERFAEHRGNGAGSTCLLSMSLDRDLIVVLLSNRDHVPHEQIVRRLRLTIDGGPAISCTAGAAEEIFATAFKGDTERATKLVRNARASGVFADAPSMFEIHDQANWLVWLDRLEEALQLRKLNVAANRSHWLPWVALGETLTHLRRPDEARSAFERALELDPGNQHALAGLQDLKQ